MTFAYEVKYADGLTEEYDTSDVDDVIEYARDQNESNLDGPEYDIVRVTKISDGKVISF